MISDLVIQFGIYIGGLVCGFVAGIGCTMAVIALDRKVVTLKDDDIVITKKDWAAVQERASSQLRTNPRATVRRAVRDEDDFGDEDEGDPIEISRERP